MQKTSWIFDFKNFNILYTTETLYWKLPAITSLLWKNIFFSFFPLLMLKMEHQDLPHEIRRWKRIQNKTSHSKILLVSNKKG